MKRLQERWTTEEFEELEELAHLVGDGYGLLDNGDRTISVYKDTDYSYGDQPDRERDNLPTFKTIGECAEYLNNILLDDEDSFDESLNNQKEDTKNMKEVLKNNKPLKEESNIDKINRYLVSIGEAPLTEAAEEDANPYDKLKKHFKSKADVDLDECDKPMKECKKSRKQFEALKLGASTIDLETAQGYLEDEEAKAVILADSRFDGDEEDENIYGTTIFESERPGVWSVEEEPGSYWDIEGESLDGAIKQVVDDIIAAHEEDSDWNLYDLKVYKKVINSEGNETIEEVSTEEKTESVKESMKRPSAKARKDVKGSKSIRECKKPVTESVKKVSAAKVGRPGSLMESMNKGFAKLYGDFDDSKSLNESYKKSKK